MKNYDFISMNMEILRSILIVDQSRVVRAALSKHLKKFYLIRDECDGELAWQTLILDSSIVAVIANVNLLRLDAFGLIERLRSNKLRRLQQTPVLLLGSGRESEQERASATLRGAAGFINKTMSKAEIVAIVAQLSGCTSNEERDLSLMTATDVCGEAMLKQAEEWPELEPPTPVPETFFLEPVFKPVTKRLLSATRLKEEIEAAIRPESPCKSTISIITFGLDNQSALADVHGADTVRRIGEKFSELLRKKIGASDQLGQLRTGCVAILAIGSGLQASKLFAEKICSSLSSAKIGSVGTRIPVTVSAGIATLHDDFQLTGEYLLLLSHRRLCQAIANGGNQVVAQGKGMPQVVENPEALVARALASVRLNQTDNISSCMATIGVQIFPLLAALDQQFSLDLPLAAIGEKLEKIAMTEWAEIASLPLAHPRIEPYASSD